MPQITCFKQKNLYFQKTSEKHAFCKWNFNPFLHTFPGVPESGKSLCRCAYNLTYIYLEDVCLSVCPVWLFFTFKTFQNFSKLFKTSTICWIGYFPETFGWKLFQKRLVENFPETFGWKLSRNFCLETFTIGWKLSRNFWLETLETFDWIIKKLKNFWKLYKKLFICVHKQTEFHKYI